MRTITTMLFAIVVAGTAASAQAQTVVTYYPTRPVAVAPAPVVPAQVAPAPVVPVTAYAAPTVTYYAAPPVVTYYAPAVKARYAPRVVVRPKVYVRGQPIRNVLRAITP